MRRREIDKVAEMKKLVLQLLFILVVLFADSVLFAQSDKPIIDKSELYKVHQFQNLDEYRNFIAPLIKQIHYPYEDPNYKFSKDPDLEFWKPFWQRFDYLQYAPCEHPWQSSVHYLS